MAEGTNWIMVDMSFDYQGSGSLEAKRNVLFVCLSMYVCMYVCTLYACTEHKVFQGVGWCGS